MTDWMPGQPIGYVRLEIPEFAMPAYQGQRYENKSPPMLDIPEPARLVINEMIEAADLEDNSERHMGFGVLVRSRPAPRDRLLDAPPIRLG